MRIFWDLDFRRDEQLVDFCSPVVVDFVVGLNQGQSKSLIIDSTLRINVADLNRDPLVVVRFRRWRGSRLVLSFAFLSETKLALSLLVRLGDGQEDQSGESEEGDERELHDFNCSSL